MRMRREFRFVRRAVIVMPGEDRVMARNGFKLIDAEMHVMEPTDLWQRYIDPEFRTRAPRRLDERRWDIRTLVEGEVMAQMPGGDWPALSDAEESALARRYAEEIARNFDPQSQVRAMDKEGLDLAILYPTSAMYVTAFTRMDPRFAAAACRAYNDWLHDYIAAADPKRMFGAAAISAHDVASAVDETRRAVGELGMKAVFLRPNIYNDLPWHDPSYDPLWAICQELNVPVGFHETTGSRMKAAGADRFNSLGIAHGIFPAPGVLRGRVRRSLRHARRRRVRRRQPGHHDRLPARRFEISQSHGHVPRPAPRRPQQAEDPVGQRAAALRAVGC